MSGGFGETTVITSYGVGEVSGGFGESGFLVPTQNKIRFFSNNEI